MTDFEIRMNAFDVKSKYDFKTCMHWCYCLYLVLSVMKLKKIYFHCDMGICSTERPYLHYVMIERENLKLVSTTIVLSPAICVVTLKNTSLLGHPYSLIILSFTILFFVSLDLSSPFFHFPPLPIVS
jgi:hypothetical protein